MDDLISREEALDCFHDWIDKNGDVHTPDEMAEYRAIEALPSAQPELSDEEKPLIKQLRSYHNGSYATVIDKLITSAQPMRKRGKWIIRKAPKGYVDYMSCPNCYTEFVKDDEYYFCPNCGADMRGEQE